MSTHAAAPASAYATYRTWGLRALRNDATSAEGEEGRGANVSGMRRGGRHARASSARRARGRRAHETRRDGRATTTSTCAARVDGARDGARVAFGLGSADGETQTPEAGMRLHAIGIPRRRDRLGRGPRKHVPSTPAACKSRVASSEDAILLFARVCDGQVRQSLADARARARSRGGSSCRLFFLGKCNRLVLRKNCKPVGV